MQNGCTVRPSFTARKEKNKKTKTKDFDSDDYMMTIVKLMQQSFGQKAIDAGSVQISNMVRSMTMEFQRYKWHKTVTIMVKVTSGMYCDHIMKTWNGALC